LKRIVHELTLLQEREGWITEQGLRELASRLGLPLHRLESVSTFYTHFRRTPPPRVEVAVCRDLSCALAGGGAARAELRAALADHDGVELREVSCLGRCDGAPAARVGHAIVPVSDEQALRATLDAPAERAPERPQRRWPAADPYAAPEEHYATLRRALAGTREAVIASLQSAGLRGMGGAGFPTARKWSLVAAEQATPKYVVCNADESEPGTFKDREILHDLPHLVIEGMLLAAWCVGAERGTIFIRHEYEAERHRLEAAIERARRSGVLGRDALGSDLDFELDLFVSPGGYVAGEETALLECLEGKRAEPRNKPPFPGTRGLDGQPTLINNVETLVHAVGIVSRGVDWWSSLGREGFAGHKFMAVSGDVADPGVRLVPFGIPLGELLEQCGGVAGGRALAAVAPGGASSRFLGPEALDVPLGFESLAEAGSMLGSGAALFVADDQDLLQLGLNVTRFFRNESCGKCVPCRLGTEKAVKLIEGADAVSGESEALLRQLDETMRQTSICGLGQVALGPLLSLLERFPDRVRRV
jgi:NADH:ubiquinone oxidoreductase subunit F (NADH-binding)/NADH:ubiquinone oxidoreductase subunit E